MRTLNAIDRLLGAEPEMGMLMAQGPGFKMPPTQEVRNPPRSWRGRAQTLAGLLLILAGISGLSYPLLATMLADLSSAPQAAESALAQDTPGLMDPKYFWADSSPQKSPQQDPQKNRKPAHSRRPAVISLAAASSQAPRVSLTRGLPLSEIRALIAAHTRGRHLSVVELNLALDQLAARKRTLTARVCVSGSCARAQR